MRFHGSVRDFVCYKTRFFDVIGFRESLLRIAEDMVVVLFGIVRLVVVNQIARGLHGFFGIEVGRQQLVFDVNQLECLFRGGFIPGGNTGDVVSDVADFVHGECVFVMADGKDAVGIRSVCADDDCYDSIQLLGLACVNTLDTRMRMRRVQNLADQHAREGQVIGVFASAGSLAGGVNHGDGLADYGEGGHKTSLVIRRWSSAKSARTDNDPEGVTDARAILLTSVSFAVPYSGVRRTSLRRTRAMSATKASADSARSCEFISSGSKSISMASLAKK